MGDVVRLDRLALRLETRSAHERVEDLIYAEDASAQVRALEPFCLYALVREAGVEESTDLIRLASGEQCQSFLDFDCWDGDRLDFRKLEAWFATIFQGPQSQIDELSSQLDPELIGLLLSEHVEIFAVRDEEEAAILDTIDGPVLSSPDGEFALVLPANEEISELIRLTVFRLYAADQDLARQTLNQTRFELRAEMEENAYRVRNGRLEQHGFLPHEEAVAIYAYRDPAKEKEEAAKLSDDEKATIDIRVERPVDLAPSFASTLYELTGSQASYFGKLLRLTCDRSESFEGTDQFLLQLTSLVNRTLMADFGDPGDLSDQGTSLRRTHGFLNIGLEFLAGGDDVAAAVILEKWPLKRVFQTGHNLVALLAKQARRIWDRGNLILNEKPRMTLCSNKELELLDGLIRPRSLRSATYEEFFDCLDHVEQSAATLALLAYKEMWTFGFREHEIDELVGVFATDVKIVTPLESITFDGLLATHAAIELVDNASEFRALELKELIEFLKVHVAPDALSDELSDILLTLAKPPQTEPAATSMKLAEQWATDVSATLVEEYGQLESSAFKDVAFLPSLIIVRSQ